MQLKILSFGIAKEIVGGPVLDIELAAEATVGELKSRLLARFPDFMALSSLAIAVDGTYAEDDWLLQEGQEIALIPPVSGG
ncbi:MAG: MoaD/ThiS family protein [Saprospiraceae bacterium]|nr:MoaD/ThiS family protein [Saprospiraceae bacterium]